MNEERGVNLEVINSRESSQSEESNEEIEESNPATRLESSNNNITEDVDNLRASIIA